MKLSLSLVSLLLLVAVTVTVNAQQNNNNNNKQHLRAVQAVTIPEDILYELHEGNCQTAEEAWATLPADQVVNQGTFTAFNARCGVNGSCFAGGTGGCCRYANGLLIECDNKNDFPHAICVCNEFTSEQRQNAAPVDAPVEVVTQPSVSPAPTHMPSLMEENCQRYNPNAAEGIFQTEHPYKGMMEAGVEGIEMCFSNDDCPDDSCCMPSFCLCKSRGASENFKCI